MRKPAPANNSPGNQNAPASMGIDPVFVCSGGISGIKEATGAVVDTVMVTVCVPFAVMLTGSTGWKLHEVPAGNPAQATWNEPAKPPTEVKVSTSVTVEPCATVKEADAAPIVTVGANASKTVTDTAGDEVLVRSVAVATNTAVTESTPTGKKLVTSTA